MIYNVQPESERSLRTELDGVVGALAGVAVRNALPLGSLAFSLSFSRYFEGSLVSYD
jgi:hypothetical protein